MSFFGWKIGKLFGFHRYQVDDVYEEVHTKHFKNKSKDINFVIREECLEVVKKNVFSKKDDTLVYEVRCHTNWWLRSLGSPDNVSEKDVIQIFNLVEVGKRYRIKYIVCGSKPNYGEIIDRVISVDDTLIGEVV